MSSATGDFHDLVQLLEEHPEWRGELRRLVLSDELLEVPAGVQRITGQLEALAEAELRTEQRLVSLAAKVELLATAQVRTKETLDSLAKSMEELQTDPEPSRNLDLTPSLS